MLVGTSREEWKVEWMTCACFTSVPHARRWRCRTLQPSVMGTHSGVEIETDAERRDMLKRLHYSNAWHLKGRSLDL